jgi:hypothetical protein
MAQNEVLGTDSVKDGLLTKINNDLAELFASLAAISAGSGVIVSANDSTPGVLNGKLVAGNSITLTEGNDGGNETLTIAVSGEVVCTSLDLNGNGDISGNLDIGSATTRRVAPAGTFVNNANGNPNISDTTFDVDSALTEATWESIGPTGGGADNTWTALDSVPTDADWIKVKIWVYLIHTTGTAGDIISMAVYGRDSGGTDDVAGVDNCLFSVSNKVDSDGDANIQDFVEVTIPVTSSIFELFYNDEGTNPSTVSVLLTLVGWGFNPTS